MGGVETMRPDRSYTSEHAREYERPALDDARHPDVPVFRMTTRALIASCDKAAPANRAVQLEGLVFNAAVDSFGSTATTGQVPHSEFRRAYNWLTQVLLFDFEHVQHVISEGCVRPSQIMTYVVQRLQCRKESACTTRPEEDVRASVRLHTVRKFTQLVGQATAFEIEESIAMARPTLEAYKAQFRAVYANMCNANTGLLDKMRMRVIDIKTLGSAGRKEMWPELWARPDRQPGHRVTVLYDDDPNEANQSMIKCNSCNQYNVRYTEFQSRSADEPMTIYCSCTCGKRWKM